jgi:hypothetical protein
MLGVESYHGLHTNIIRIAWDLAGEVTCVMGQNDFLLMIELTTMGLSSDFCSGKVRNIELDAPAHVKERVL